MRIIILYQPQKFTMRTNEIICIQHSARHVIVLKSRCLCVIVVIVAVK